MNIKKRLAMIMAVTLCIVSCMGCSSTTDTEEISIEEESSTEETSTPTQIIYTDADATGNNDGTSWENAYLTLTDALEEATAGCAIWVAEGTYYPTDDGDQSISFTMKDDVSVYGGFNGTETSLDERDWETYVTVLSGDIGVTGDSSDNSTKVVIAANNLIDGFTITAGQGNTGVGSDEDMAGGEMPPEGMEGDEMSENITDSDMDNEEIPSESTNSGITGGGMNGEEMPEEGTGEYGQAVGHLTTDIVTAGDATTSMHGNGIIIWNVAPTIKNCIITDNNGGKGAAVYILGLPESGELPTFINTVFSNNNGYGRGGAISMDMDTKAYFIDCIFDSNDCEAGKGGAIYNDIMASPLLENCLFINNTAESGAAMANDGNSNTIYSHCTFYNNTATEEGAALYQGSGAYNDPVVINSIIYGNYCDQGEVSVYDWAQCNPNISYSIVEYGYDGEGVLDVDPEFVDPDNMDFSLSETSPALTASDEGGQIGFDASLIDQRTDEDYETIKTYLQSLAVFETIEEIDLTNPVASEDATYIESVVYVDIDATGNNDGSSWEDAFTDVQDAIDYANASYLLTESYVEVWVAEGTYYTGEDRNDSFILREGVSVYGGFAGDETALSQRNYDANITILSGEIGDTSDVTDNSYHVVIGADNATIDGFTITGGYADGEDGLPYNKYGGGMLNFLAGFRDIPMIDYTIGFDVIVNNCIFSDNYAETGGATYTFHGGNPEYTSCTFINNTAKYGAASADVAGCNSIYTDCEFLDNYAIYKGGAIFTDYGSMSLFYDCNFEGNESGTAGGAIYVLDRASQEINNEMDFYLIDDTWSVTTDIYSSVYLENCSLVDNTAGTNGGAMYVYEASFAKIINSIFENNTSTDAAIVANNEATVILDDATTFVNNSPEDTLTEQLSQIIYE
ncbi:MAG: right-handed parallel beta-helix repeat-containing protein [Eubacteriales bacterium]